MGLQLRIRPLGRYNGSVSDNQFPVFAKLNLALIKARTRSTADWPSHDIPPRLQRLPPADRFAAPHEVWPSQKAQGWIVTQAMATLSQVVNATSPSLDSTSAGEMHGVLRPKWMIRSTRSGEAVCIDPKETNELISALGGTPSSVQLRSMMGLLFTGCTALSAEWVNRETKLQTRTPLAVTSVPTAIPTNVPPAGLAALPLQRWTQMQSPVTSLSPRYAITLSGLASLALASGPGDGGTSVALPSLPHIAVAPSRAPGSTYPHPAPRSPDGEADTPDHWQEAASVPATDTQELSAQEDGTVFLVTHHFLRLPRNVADMRTLRALATCNLALRQAVLMCYASDIEWCFATALSPWTGRDLPLWLTTAASTVRGPRHRHLPQRAVWDRTTARPSWVPAPARNAHTSCVASTRGCSRSVAAVDAATNAPQLPTLLALSGLRPRALLFWSHHDLRRLHQRVRPATLYPL